MKNNEQIAITDYISRLKNFFEESQITSFKSDNNFWYVKGRDKVTDEDKKLTENIDGLYEIIDEYAKQNGISDNSMDLFEYFTEYSTSEYVINLGDNVIIRICKLYKKKVTSSGKPFEELIGFNCTKLALDSEYTIDINDIINTKDNSVQKVMRYK